MSTLRQQIADARQRFVEIRTAEMLADVMTFKSLFDEALESTEELAILTALRNAVQESGVNWDGITAFQRILQTVASARAADEWDAIGQTEEPTRCAMCHDTGEGQHDGARCGFCSDHRLMQRAA